MEIPKRYVYEDRATIDKLLDEKDLPYIPESWISGQKEELRKREIKDNKYLLSMTRPVLWMFYRMGFCIAPIGAAILLIGIPIILIADVSRIWLAILGITVVVGVTLWGWIAQNLNQQLNTTTPWQTAGLPPFCDEYPGDILQKLDDCISCVSPDILVDIEYCESSIRRFLYVRCASSGPRRCIDTWEKGGKKKSPEKK